MPAFYQLICYLAYTLRVRTFGAQAPWIPKFEASKILNSNLSKKSEKNTMV
jgi:hypothetical protein